MPPEPIQPKKEIHPPLFIAILLVITGLIGSFQVYEFLYSSPASRRGDGGEVFDKKVTTQDTTQNWKTYRNDKFKYELSYPNKWVIDNTSSNQDFEVRGGGEHIMGGDTYWENYEIKFDELEGPMPEPKDHRNLYLIVFKDKKSQTIDDYFGPKNYPNNISKLLEAHDFVTSRGEKGRHFVIESLDHPVGAKTVLTIFKNGQDFYTFNSPIQSEEIHNQILSTFKFISTSTPN